MKTFTKIQKHSQNGTSASNSNKMLTALVLCTLLLFATKALAQTTHIVNNNVGTVADFTDLQAAIDAAANGDIIHVQQSSTSYGNVILDKELTLIGRSHSDASYRSIIGILRLKEGCSNSTIKGLEINGVFENTPVVNGPFTISDLVFFDNKIAGVQIGQANNFNNILFQGNYINGNTSILANSSNILISNNVFSTARIEFREANTVLFTNNIVSMTSTSIQLINASSGGLLNISNCIFAIRRSGNYTISFTGQFQISNCITYNYSGGTLNFATGSNITLNNVQENVDPLFTNITVNGSLGFNQVVPGLDDLTLQASSPVVDDGLYQGYNFKPLGTPTGVPSLKIDSYSPTVPKNSDLNVTITAKTN